MDQFQPSPNLLDKLKDIEIARVSTVPFFVYSQLSTQLKDIHLSGANVTIITSPPKPYEKGISFDSMHSIIEVEVPRKIEIINDIKALLSLYAKFRKLHFDITHSTTPKAGLLTCIASFCARTPIRLHTFTGQTWVDKKGLSRTLYKLLDKLIIKLNHHCYADSESQMQFLISEGVCKQKDISVLGKGSLAGVDIERFNPRVFSKDTKVEIRSSLKISSESIVIIFVGRITIDKGILELLKAFEILLSNNLNVTLLLVGPIDGDVTVDEVGLGSYFDSNDNIIATGFTDAPEQYFSIADIFCLPSYREGFGTVIIESASMGVPAVASDIYGLNDAVQDGETGILVDVKNVDSLVVALTKLSTDRFLRTDMGKKARKRAISDFDSKKVNSLVVGEYKRLIDGINDK